MYQIVTMLSINRDWLLTANLLLAVLLLLWVLRYSILYRTKKQEAEQYLSSLDELNEGFYRAEIDGKMTYANHAMVKLMGYNSFEEFQANTKKDKGACYTDPDRRKLFHETLVKDGFVRDFVSETRNAATGEIVWVSENAHYDSRDNAKHPTHYEGLVLNITDAVQREKLEDRIEKLSDNLPGGLFQLHVYKVGNLSLPYASLGCHNLTGLSKSDLENPLLFLQNIHPDYRKRCAHTLTVSLEAMSIWSVDFKIKRPEGGDLWVSILATPQRMDDDTIILHGHINDISERKTAEGKIAYNAYYDALTGLPNRAFFMHHLEKAVNSSSRTAAYKALLFLDIDNFKIVNDKYGHAIGDILLKKVAKRIDQMTRSNDTASRFGGDEFVFLLDEIGADAMAAKRNAKNVANKILKEIQQDFQLGEHKYQCTPSIGVFTFNGETTNCDTLIKNADTAMYEAKRGGKNKVVVFGDSTSNLPTDPMPLSIEKLNKAQHEEVVA